jgi:hypothetical protein
MPGILIELSEIESIYHCISDHIIQKFIQGNMGSSTQIRYEKEWLQKEMNGFSATESDAWRLLADLYGPKISKEQIISLGQVAAMELGLDLVREYKRRKETMVKWFQNHLTTVTPFLRTSVVILGENKTVISAPGKVNKP